MFNGGHLVELESHAELESIQTADLPGKAVRRDEITGAFVMDEVSKK